MGSNNPNQAIVGGSVPTPSVSSASSTAPTPLATSASGTASSSQQVSSVSSVAVSSATPAATYKNMFSTSIVRSSSSDVNVSHFTRAYREKAKDKEHLTLVEAITKPLSVEMTHLDFSKLEELDEEVFVTNEKLENFMIELVNRLAYYGMADILQEHIILGKEQVVGDDRTKFDPNNNVGEIVDFTKKWDQTGPGKTYPAEKIAEANAWKLKYTMAKYEMVLKDGKLLHELLVRSMSPQLKDTVMSELYTNHKQEERSGSLTFVIMLQFVINLSKPAVDGLKRSLEKQTLSNIPGQNVYVLARRINYGLDCLCHNNAFPHDVVSLILDMMMTSSVLEFNTWIEHWKNAISFTDSDLHPTYQTVLKKFVAKYQELCVGGMWNGTDNASQGSIFKSETGTSNKKGTTPNSSKERNSSTNVWRRPSEDKLVEENPPKYCRVIKKKVMKWCSKCKNRTSGQLGRWNQTYFTNEHVFKDPKANVARGKGIDLDDDRKGDPPKKKVSFKDALTAEDDHDEE